MEGSAVLTMVVSSDYAKKPNATIQSCHSEDCCQEVLSYLYYRFAIYTRKAAADDRRGTPPAWYRASELAHDQTAEQWLYPQRLP